MISCKRATELLSRAQDEKLRPYEKLVLRFHLTLCSVCRNFGAHLRVLRLAARALRKNEQPDSSVETMSDSSKKRIVDALRKQSAKDD